MHNAWRQPYQFISIIEKEGSVYITTHSTHFYLRLYGVGYIEEDNSDSERGNRLPPLLELKIVYIIRHKRIIIRNMAFVTPVLKLSGSAMRDRSDDPSHHACYIRAS